MPALRHLTSAELAERLDVTEQTLKDWRRDGRGPDFLQDGRKFIRYRLCDVEAWEKSRLVRTGDTTKAQATSQAA
jgi:transposase-like protein